MARFQWRKFLIIFLVVAGGCYFSVWGLMAWLYPAPVPCEKSADKNVQQTLDEVYPKTKNIEIVGHLGGEVESVVIRGNRAIVDIGPELAIFDISDPADLKRIGYILLPGKLIFVSPDGVYAIILYEGSRDEGYGLWKVALTDPENMTAIHLFSPGGSIDDIRIRDTKAQMIVSRCKLYGSPLGFLEGSFDRCKQSFQIIDFSLDTFKPTSACYPTILGRAVSFFANVGLTEPDYKVATDDQFAFSASGVHGLQVFDFSDPSNPSLINTYPSPTFVDNLEVFDNFVYMNRRLVPEIGSPREYYLDVYDISNPREPVLVNSVPKLYYFYTIVDNIAFTRIGKSNYEFKTIDLSQPKNLSEVIIPDYLRVSDLKIINGYAYLIDEGTFLGTRVLKILDLRVAASPREIFSYEFPTDTRISDFEIRNHYLYVSTEDINDDGRILIFDVASPENTSLFSIYNANAGSRMFFQDNFIYMSGGFRKIDIVDISNPKAPYLVNTIKYILGDLQEVRDNYLYIKDRYNGLEIYQIQNTGIPSLASTEEIGLFAPLAPFTPSYSGIEDFYMTDNYIYVVDGKNGLYILRFSPPE